MKYDRKGRGGRIIPRIDSGIRIMANFSIRSQHFDVVQHSRSGHDICSSYLPHLRDYVWAVDLYFDSTRSSSGQATPLYMSLANRFLNSTTTRLVKFKVLDQRLLRPCQANADDSPLPLGLAASAQRFVSWLFANDRLSTYYPILIAASMCR